MTKLNILQYTATIVSILGILLIALKDTALLGFYVSLLATLLWTTYGYLTKQYGIVINSVFYGISEIIGIIKYTQ
jgi:nicotinamide mononucleotide transporter